MAGDFGTRFMPEMALATYDGGWSDVRYVSSETLPLHPGAHVLHYASTCFEGLKAFRHRDGRIGIFRMDRNVARFAESSRLLCLPPLDEAQTAAMIVGIVKRFRDEVPAPPASMYIRPTHIGNEASIGKAAAPSATSLQYVLLSPVGDYFAGGEASLRLWIERDGVRCGHDHGKVKGGGNYASALKHMMRAQARDGVDQVLFSPDGHVQETGAANFVLIENGELVTKPLDASFLHGITRDSVLTLARERGLAVAERELPVEELLERAARPGCEAGLTGTAAVLASVGTLITEAGEHRVGDGRPGPEIRALRDALNAIQWGEVEDTRGWMTFV